jgi:hypothetical protein
MKVGLGRLYSLDWRMPRKIAKRNKSQAVQ